MRSFSAGLGGVGGYATSTMGACKIIFLAGMVACDEKQVLLCLKNWRNLWKKYTTPMSASITSKDTRNLLKLAEETFSWPVRR